MQARPSNRIAALLVGALLIPGPGALEAQEEPRDTLRSDQEGVLVRGRVVDLSSSRPLPAASVVLEHLEDPEGGWSGLTDSVGVFRAPRLPPAEYTIRVEALGFDPLEHRLALAGYGSADLQIELAPAALELEPIVVVSRRRTRLENAGFYERRERGFGHSLTREEIEERQAMFVTDLVRTMPGVTVTPGTMGRGGVLRMRGGCEPDVVLDGVRLSAPVRLDDILSVNDLEGIEIYSGSTTPMQYSRSSCGTVLAWTRDPGTGDGKPWSWKRVGAAAGFLLLGWLLAG